MVAVLVAIAVMSVFLSVALPVWRTLAQREKEEELLWRGQQYARAILLYQRKTSAPGPPNIDLLVDQRFLRRKYKDPITNDDFELVAVGTPGTAGATGMPRAPGTAPGRQTRSGRDETTREEEDEADENRPGMPSRGFGQLIGGVRSKSKKRSLKIVNGRSFYNEWEFTYEPYQAGPQPTTPGGSGPRIGQPSQRQRGLGAGSGSGPGRSSGSGRTTRRPFQPQ